MHKFIVMYQIYPVKSEHFNLSHAIVLWPMQRLPKPVQLGQQMAQWYWPHQDTNTNTCSPTNLYSLPDTAFQNSLAKTHSSSTRSPPVYATPDGAIYYVEINTLKQFGFPRVKNIDKTFKWKKMNFLTYIPKFNARVAYLVGTGRSDSEVYRMHVVAQAGIPIISQHCRLLCWAQH